MNFMAGPPMMMGPVFTDASMLASSKELVHEHGDYLPKVRYAVSLTCALSNSSGSDGQFTIKQEDGEHPSHEFQKPVTMTIVNTTSEICVAEDPKVLIFWTESGSLTHLEGLFSRGSNGRLSLNPLPKRMRELRLG
jgi:hypothetical protein